jgi:dihydroneopterin aldolase
MGLIALEGMRFHAFHGVYEAERKLGTSFVVDIYVNTMATLVAGATDNPANALNYETVYMLCKMEMQQPRNLIEAVASGIMRQMKNQFDNMMSLKVRIRKLNPPLGGVVGASMVEEEEQYMSMCPRCQKGFINYQPGDCWARVPNIYSGTKETLLRQFGDKCLCDNCLKFFAG